MDKDKAEEHSASRECLSKKFQCGTCTMEYKNASLLQRHKCGGKPKYERFYCNNFNNTVNTMKIAMVMMMILIRNKSFFSGVKTLTSLTFCTCWVKFKCNDYLQKKWFSNIASKWKQIQSTWYDWVNCSMFLVHTCSVKLTQC